MVVSFKPYSLALYELAKDKDQVPYYMEQLKKLFEKNNIKIEIKFFPE